MFSYEVGYFNQTPNPIIDALSSYKNINFNRLDINEYSKNTPLEGWIEEGNLFKSNYFVVHASDVIRMLTLWKYSGTYFDIDVIVKNEIASMGSNFVGLVHRGSINNAVINFNSSNGKLIAEKYFKELIRKFDGRLWNGNGPDIMTTMAREMCNTRILASITSNCNGLNVLPTKAFYEIDWSESNKFFDAKYSDEVMERTKDSHVIHFWNALTGSIVTPQKLDSGDYSLVEFIDAVWVAIKNFLAVASKLSTKSNAAYIKLAKQYCPKVLAASGQFF